MKKKLTMVAFLLVLFFVCFQTPVKAASVPVIRGGKQTNLYGTIVRVRYGSNVIGECNANAAPAMKIGSTLYLPCKTVYSDNGIHADYQYNPASRSVTITYGARKMILYPNSKKAYVNGTWMALASAPFPVKFTRSGMDDLMVPAKQISILMGLKYSYANGVITLVAKADAGKTATKVSTIAKSRFLNTIGPIARADYHRTGILASVTIAQAILESGWGQSYVAKNGNNLFGIKKGKTTYYGGGWDGVNSVRKGSRYRKYSCAEDSISDHSAYLLGAKKGRRARYAGITKTKSYKTQLQIIRRGGYCTSGSYVSQLCRVIQRYNLSRFDN